MGRTRTEMPRTWERARFWADGIFREFAPYSVAKKRTIALLDRVASGVPDDIMARVDYYAKRRTPFGYYAHINLGNLSWGMNDMYYVDLMRIAKGFGKRFAVNPIFGIVTEVPPMAAIVRCRPIEGDVDNSFLFPMNRFRHLYFPEDPVPWEQKSPTMAWRGRANGKHPRIRLLERYHDHPEHDIGHIREGDPHPGYKSFLSVYDHMKHRYIITFEGVDVATNIKWAMGSGSVAICHPMKYETWFMEGRLEEGVHYIGVREDLADLEEKLAWYNDHKDEARQIVANANAWVAPFKDTEREDLIATLVLLRYAKLLDRNMPPHLEPYKDLV